jgi:hypothetical protein
VPDLSAQIRPDRMPCPIMWWDHASPQRLNREPGDGLYISTLTLR